MNVKIMITDSKNIDFMELIKLLDFDLEERYGAIQKQYEKFNKVDYINDVIILYDDKIPVACGAFKEHANDSIELKRIFVKKENRQQGLSKIIVAKLEELAKLRGYKHALLETGIKQYEAISLYKKLGYNIIPNFVPYIGNENSICMGKAL